MSKPSFEVRLPPGIAGEEQRARELLAQEKWRNARDFIKPLVKADRARFLPLLIQANVGLVRKMMANGEASAARQVLSYLATLVPPDQFSVLELEFAGTTELAEQSLPKLIAVLAGARGPTLSEAQRVCFADLAVLAFRSIPPDGLSPEGGRLAAELRAIHEALRAVSLAQWPVVSDLLRGVSHRSPLSYWAVFIKGAVAFHAGETDRAVKLWGTLPTNSTPLKASRAYLLVAGRLVSIGPVQTITDREIECAGQLAGVRGASSVLMRADALWRKGNENESYRVLRDGVPQFPSRGLDWVGAMTEFYFKAPHQMATEDRENYLDYLDGLIDEKGPKNGEEPIWVFRLFALAAAEISSPEELREKWEDFIDSYTAVYGKKPRWLSLAFGWLGEKLSQPKPDRWSAKQKPILCDSDGAIKTLQQSIDLDPTNLQAHLVLCEVYNATDQTSSRNRLLDTMAKQFPDEKKVLLHAAERCLDRKAFSKGLDYLARALQLDRLDPAIPEMTVSALRQWARQHFQQHLPDKARAKLAQAESLSSDNAGDFSRGRWTGFIRHAVMEYLWGDAAEAEALFKRARECAPTPLTYLFFAQVTHRAYTEKTWRESPILAELEKAVRRAATLTEIARLLSIVDFWKRELPTLYSDDEEGLIADAFKKAVNQPFTRAEAVEVYEKSGKYPALEKPLKAMIKEVLRRDPLDPRFRLWSLQINNRPQDFASEEIEPLLQSILDEAGRRGDDASTREARMLMEAIDEPEFLDPDDFDPDSDDPDDIFADDDDDDDDDFDEKDDFVLPPELTEDKMGLFAQIIEIMRDAPEAALKSVRKKLVKTPEDEILFNGLLAAAKQGLPINPPKPLSPKSQGKPEKPPKPPPPSDPKQLNLF